MAKKKVQALLKSNWTPSPQLIQGVMNVFKVPHARALQELTNMGKMGAVAKINFAQIPDQKILSMMMQIKNVIAKKQASNINNNRK